MAPRLGINLSPSYYGTHCTNRLDRPWDVRHVYSSATKEADAVEPSRLVGGWSGLRVKCWERDGERDKRERRPNPCTYVGRVNNQTYSFGPTAY